MRYAIFSDVHANLSALEAVRESCAKEAIDEYLCLGDLVGYATRPKECIDLLRSFAKVIIAGNHDWAAIDKLNLDYFNLQAKKALIWTKTQLKQEEKDFLSQLKLIYQNKELTLVHGTLNEPENFNYIFYIKDTEASFGLLETQVCFVGHSHVAGVFIQEKAGQIYYTFEPKIALKQTSRYIVNVGSVGQPRDGNPKASYFIFDTEEKELINKRVSYDIAKTQKEILKAGLPAGLAQRLALGV
jgi:predicted phosphodiesterase